MRQFDQSIAELVIIAGPKTILEVGCEEGHRSINRLGVSHKPLVAESCTYTVIGGIAFGLWDDYINQKQI